VLAHRLVRFAARQRFDRSVIHDRMNSLRDLMGLFRATAIRDVRNHNAKIRRFVVEVFRVEISLNTELKRTGFAVGEPSGVS
jgi:hypothetical protein